MQVASVSRPAPPAPERDPSRQTLVAGLLLSLTPPAAPFRSEPAELTEQLRAERREAINRRQRALQARDQGLTQQLRDNERRMRPGSHSFRQTLRREQLLKQAAPQPKAEPTAPRQPSAQPAADAPAPTPTQPNDRKPAALPRPNAPTSSNQNARAPRSTASAARTPSSDAPTQPAGWRGTTPPVAPAGPPSSLPVSAGPAAAVTRVFAPATAPGTAPTQGRSAPVTPAARSDAVSHVAGTQRNRPAAVRRLAGVPEHADPAETRAQREQRIERIVRVVRHSLQRGQTRATLRLDPPQIGKLRIDIKLRASALHLRFEPTHELAHRLLREQSAELAAALRAAGLEPQRIEIAPAPDRPPHDGQAHGGTQHQGGTAGGDPHGGRSARETTVITGDRGPVIPEKHAAPGPADAPRTAHGVNVWA